MDAADVKRFFDEVADEWDEMRTSFYNERVIDALADRTRIDSRQTVADIGTGTGFVAAGLGPRASQVVGIDQAGGMLAKARRNFAALGVDNVTLMQGTVDALPLADDAVDAAVANMVLHHAPQPAEMLAEMARIVRPGGWVAITDEIEHRYEWMRTEQGDLWLGFSEREIEALFTGERLVDYGYASLGMQ